MFTIKNSKPHKFIKRMKVSDLRETALEKKFLLKQMSESIEIYYKQCLGMTRSPNFINKLDASRECATISTLLIQLNPVAVYSSNMMPVFPVIFGPNHTKYWPKQFYKSRWRLLSFQKISGFLSISPQKWVFWGFEVLQNKKNTL